MLYRLRHWLDRRRRPARFAHLDALLRNNAQGRAAVLAKQQRDLAAIVAHAVAQVPYYREKIGAIPWQADGTLAIDALPILHKEDVIGRMDDLLAADADRSQVKIGYTGGSTGKPLAFYYDDAKHELMRAGMCRSYMGSGWQPGQKILNFWGAPQDVGAGGVFGGSFADAIAAEKTIPAFRYTEAQLHQWAATIRRYRPVLLQGYASILAGLARFVVDQAIAMPGSLIGVYSTAEVLDDRQREIMEQAFGCKVFNQYGSREIPNIGCECRHGNMHVFTDMIYLESHAEDGEDRLLVTSLTNRQMPFIRYDIGDAGRLMDGNCDCGWPFPLMAMGMCRQNDLIRTRGGKCIHPSFFNRLLYGLTQIEQYQFVQEAPDRIVLNIVAAGPLPPDTENSLAQSIRRDVDAQMAFELNHVDEIQRTASGKHRFVISAVPYRQSPPRL